MSRILIIEHDSKIAQIMKNLLEVSGYEIEIALERKTGFDQIDRFKPDLILLDLMMPRRSGWKVFDELNRRNSTIPVIVVAIMSALKSVRRNDPEIRVEMPPKILEERGVKLGYPFSVGYLAKEHYEKSLAAVVANMIKTRGPS